MIRTENLTRIFRTEEVETIALNGVNIEVEDGEFIAIMGPSGCGKSTLLNILGLLDSPTEGKYWLNNEEVGHLKDRERTAYRKGRIGFVFQSFNLVPTLDARSNILLPMRLAGKTPDKDWFDLIVNSLGIADRLNHRPSEMSGGQQQRVAVARALMSRPAVIVADEPTGNLDSHSTTEVMDLLRRAVDELGQSVIMVTHDTGTAAYADRVLVCRDGRIVSDLRDVTADTLTAALR